MGKWLLGTAELVKTKNVVVACNYSSKSKRMTENYSLLIKGLWACGSLK
jgi:hypothetical protein